MYVTGMYITYRYCNNDQFKNVRIITVDYYRHWESGICSLPNAECVRINTFCVCHCMSGYFIQTGNCLKGKIPIIICKSNNFIL